MSRSFKKVPVCGWSCAESEKKDKRKANRKFRRKIKNKVSEISKLIPPVEDIEESPFMTPVYDFGVYDDDVLPSKVEEVSDKFTFAKDGKQYVKGKEAKKIIRK